MHRRKFKIKVRENALNYFGSDTLDVNWAKELFKNHHTDRYLLQNFYNLQEKYERGQSDFTKDLYVKLANFVKNEIPSNLVWSGLEVMWYGPSKPPHIDENDTGMLRRIIQHSKEVK